MTVLPAKVQSVVVPLVRVLPARLCLLLVNHPYLVQVLRAVSHHHHPAGPPCRLRFLRQAPHRRVIVLYHRVQFHKALPVIVLFHKALPVKVR